MNSLIPEKRWGVCDLLNHNGREENDHGNRLLEAATLLGA